MIFGMYNSLSTNFQFLIKLIKRRYQVNAPLYSLIYCLGQSKSYEANVDDILFVIRNQVESNRIKNQRNILKHIPSL